MIRGDATRRAVGWRPIVVDLAVLQQKTVQPGEIVLESRDGAVVPFLLWIAGREAVRDKGQ